MSAQQKYPWSPAAHASPVPAPATPGVVTPIDSKGHAALVAVGVLVARSCAGCRRRHLALYFAPVDAPCSQCALTSATRTATAPPPGRRWSPTFVAFAEGGAQ